ncbi:Flagellar biosynthesis protein FlhF [compost metagenome]
MKIKMDLGPDAVILHSRTFKRGGIFGFFSKEQVEVLAAIDTPERPFTLRPSAPVPEPAVRVPEPTPRETHAPEPKFEVAATIPVAPRGADKAELAEIREAVGEVKQILSTVKTQLEVPRATTAAPWPEKWQPLYERMVASELDPSLIQTLMTRLVQESDVEQGVRALEPTIIEWLQGGGPIETATGAGPTIVALVGPTGVGKTTTIAKLAANFRLLAQKDVGLITIDTYRVAAVEQLRTYGDIIGIPVEVVLTPSALKQALDRFQNKDLVLIDTAGRSPSNRMHLNELKGFLDFPHPKEVHLVLSATTNRANLQKVVDAFTPVGIDRLAFTKIDESVAFGGLVSTAHALGKPLSYLTTGQSVPDDIREAEPQAIAKALIDELLS